LRTHLGWTPNIQARPGPAMAAKLMLAAAHKAVIVHKARTPVLAESFQVEPAVAPAN